MAYHDCDFDQTHLKPHDMSGIRRYPMIGKLLYRARVARATYSARQSDARIKSHDCTGMNGMHINDCAHAHSYGI